MTWRGLLLSVLLAGCVSTPEATPERDAEAKQFIARADAATIYVYRPDFPPAEMDDPALYVDDRLIGAALPQTFFRIDVRPGEHLLQAYAPHLGSVKINARFGDIHFVSLNVTGGTLRFTPVKPETGKPDILRCCALLENWAPGQRPLLR